MRFPRTPFWSTPLVVALAACAGNGAPPPVTVTANALTPAERQAGWVLLFDGRSTGGWRGFRETQVPSGWTVVDGALTRTGPANDIITLQQYGDFELALEWKVAPGGNSGVLYRVTEEAERTYHTGPEMQVLDDAAHRDGLDRRTAAGACYGLYPAPAGVVRPAGEWNQARILVRGSQVEHWLNGQRMAQYELGGPDWSARVAASKFQEWPGYGRARRGHIALQDHGDLVAYRNIKLRELPGTTP